MADIFPSQIPSSLQARLRRRELVLSPLSLALFLFLLIIFFAVDYVLLRKLAAWIAGIH